jgi:ribosomal-protein-alanine N-acetyltransferase
MRWFKKPEILMEQKPPKMTPIVRWLLERDMDMVMDIEALAFPRHCCWERDDFERAIKKAAGIGYVAECGLGNVYGYMVYLLHPKRLELLNFAVDPHVHRRGIGRAMVEKLVGKLSMTRRTHIDLHVRESNLPAQLFFRQMGFRAIEVKHGFYNDCDETAFLMRYRYRKSPDEKALPINRISRLR